jgi:DnaJ like chaperone protein
VASSSKQEILFSKQCLVCSVTSLRPDGRISSDEIAQAEALMDKMRLDSVSRKRAIELFKSGAKPEFSIDEAMQEFMRVCGRYNNLKQQLLNYLISLAMADGDLDPSEQEVLAKGSTPLRVQRCFIQAIY